MVLNEGYVFPVKASGGNGDIDIFVVNFYYDEDEEKSYCDKTYDEIVEVTDEGKKLILGFSDGFAFTYVGYDPSRNEAIFNGNTQYAYNYIEGAEDGTITGFSTNQIKVKKDGTVEGIYLSVNFGNS